MTENIEKKTAKLSDFLDKEGQTEVLYMAEYLAKAKLAGIEILEFYPGQIQCLHSCFDIPVDWNWKMWGIEIKVISLIKK